MRRLVLASMLLLAGCAAAPQTPPPQPVQAAPAPQPEPDTRRLIGLTGPELVSRFGNPALQVHEGNSIKLQFRSPRCVLDAYLYPSANGALRVTYVDTRLPSGADTSQAACISSLGVAS